MKHFHCRDSGMNCDFVASGNYDQDIIDLAGRHAQKEHHQTVTPALVDKIRGLIHEETSEAHRQSMAAPR